MLPVMQHQHIGYDSSQIGVVKGHVLSGSVVALYHIIFCKMFIYTQQIGLSRLLLYMCVKCHECGLCLHNWSLNTCAYMNYILSFDSKK